MVNLFIRTKFNSNEWRRFRAKKKAAGLPVAQLCKDSHYDRCYFLSVRMPENGRINPQQQAELTEFLSQIEPQYLRLFRLKDYCCVISPAYKLNEAWLVEVGTHLYEILSSRVTRRRTSTGADSHFQP